MGYGWALEQLQAGHKVCRMGWNGKGMYLRYVDAAAYEVDVTLPLDCRLLPWIGMKTADNCFVPWLCSQTDGLAVDWELAA